MKGEQDVEWMTSQLIGRLKQQGTEIKLDVLERMKNKSITDLDAFLNLEGALMWAKTEEGFEFVKANTEDCVSYPYIDIPLPPQHPDGKERDKVLAEIQDKVGMMEAYNKTLRGWGEDLKAAMEKNVDDKSAELKVELQHWFLTALNTVIGELNKQPNIKLNKLKVKWGG